jgi:hypothetical protein
VTQSASIQATVARYNDSVEFRISRKKPGIAVWVEDRPKHPEWVAEARRIGSDADTWQARMQKLNGGRLLGRFFAASRHQLRGGSERLGLRRAVNLGGCLVT